MAWSSVSTRCLQRMTTAFRHQKVREDARSVIKVDQKHISGYRK